MHTVAGITKFSAFVIFRSFHILSVRKTQFIVVKREKMFIPSFHKTILEIESLLFTHSMCH